MAFELDDTTVRLLASWLTTLRRWNRRIDLTAARTDDELVDLAVADAIVLSRSTPPSSCVIDVGAGAGAPGLALALLRPDLSVTLVEPSTKRVAFLRSVVGSTRTVVRVLRARGEDLTSGDQRWDLALSRATLEPSAWLRLGLSLCKPATGLVAVMLARQPPPSMSGAVLAHSETYAWPHTGVNRTLCLYHREGEG